MFSGEFIYVSKGDLFLAKAVLKILCLSSEYKKGFDPSYDKPLNCRLVASYYHGPYQNKSMTFSPT